MIELKVRSVHFLTESLFELQLERGKIVFEPGSCVAVFNPQGESRPYSIASGTGESALRLLIRRLPGGQVSDWLADRKPGDGLTISAPFGWFRPAGGQAGKRVYFATGTGIAPFLSCLRSRPAAQPELCLYGVTRQMDAFALPELQNQPWFRLATSQERQNGHFYGRITGLLDQVPLATDIHYYLCGLDSMIDDISTWLESRGIDFTQIHREIFFYENG
ncbi:ferredoxin--NADP reductase [Pelobacter seleniigenes]|uniref:ferredoxin--NADP reductase n=1 Tax=Pelobacter seleniigenes TaxID=407188 RepID=UPI0004A75C7B|nr:FAD-binding oxidoreductase [Pelobacter seleniigenes]